MFSFGKSKTSAKQKEKNEKTLPDINSNMAPVTQGHPFLHGCKNLPTDKDEELKQLKSWIQTQPHLPPLTDNHLFLFLHSNYYNLEETQNTIDAYFTIRTTSPELFSNRSPSRPANKMVWDLSNMVAVPKTTPEGYKVLLYRLGDPDPSKIQFNDVLNAFFLFNDVRLSEDGLANGYIVIFDMKGVCLGHLTRINLTTIRKFMNYIQEGHPARLKGVHIINAVAFMDKILTLVRPLMKTGLIKLLTIHGSDLTNLFKTVPQEILPEDYGGKEESVQKMHGSEHGMTPSTLKHPFINGCDEIPKDKIDDIRKIQSWIKTQPTLPKLTDEHVYMFFHSNYYNLASTQNTIHSFYALRTSAPDMFLNQSPKSPVIQSGLDALYMAPLPKATPEGYKVIVYKLSDPDPDKFIHLHVSKAIILFNDVRLSEDGITPGYMVVCDARGFSFTHLTKLHLHILRVYLKYMQEAKPIRLKGLHVIYSAKIIDKLVALVKPFMKAELQKVLKIHAGNDLTNFFKYVPQEIMPEDYGGKTESLAVLSDKHRKMMETKYVKWIEEEEAFLVEAAKLQNKKNKVSVNANEAEQSLRNLAID